MAACEADSVEEELLSGRIRVDLKSVMVQYQSDPISLVLH